MLAELEDRVGTGVARREAAQPSAVLWFRRAAEGFRAFGAKALPAARSRSGTSPQSATRLRCGEAEGARLPSLQ